MKHLFLPLATTTTLLLLLFLLLSTPPTNATDITVYDAIGEPLVAGQSYYLVPYEYIDVGGGGLTWKQKVKSEGNCAPYYVSQQNENTDFGSQITFFPQNTRQTEITTSTELNIVFDSYSPPYNCPGSSNVWRTALDRATQTHFIELAGRKGTRDVRTWFTIQELGPDLGGYKIRYCPRHRQADCGDLGIFPRANVIDTRWLCVNGSNPLAFMFESEELFLKNKARRSVPTYNLGTTYAE